MPSVNQIIQMRQLRRSREKRSPGSRLALGCAGLISVLLAIAGISLTIAFSQLSRDLPSIEILPSLLEPPDGILLQPTRLYDQSGERVLLSLQNPAAARRQYLRLRTAAAPGLQGDNHGPYLPNNLILATLANSDPNFWGHPGLSLTSFRLGASKSLAQRLASALLLQSEPPGLRRELRERLLALQITSRFGREKVLEWYLNSANYGRLAYGADAGALLYFGKSATDLNLAEAAMLAATGEAPALNPLDAPQAALERQKFAIQAMLAYRLITPQEGIQAARQELKFQNIDQQGKALAIEDLEPGVASAFASLALSQLQPYFPAGMLERGGLRIITTLDYSLQYQVSCAARIQLELLSSGTDTYPPAEFGDCEAARLLTVLPDPGEAISTGLNADALVLDPHSGHVLAMVGKSPASWDEFSLATHPTGSMVTPFIYLTALTRGMSPATLVWDTPDEGNTPPTSNFDGLFHGPLRLRMALANDYLVPAEKVLAQVGIENVWRTAQQMGIRYPNQSQSTDIEPPFVLRDMNLLEASQVFGILANQGIQVGRPVKEILINGTDSNAQETSALQPVTVLRVEDQSGQVLLDWKTSRTRPIISAQLAYLMTNMLSDESARWSSLGHPNGLEIGRPAAVKASRTLDGESNWVIGYTPQLVVGAWVGAPETSLHSPKGQNQALPGAVISLWHAIIQYASRDLDYKTWTIPADLSTIQVCDPSGMLPTPDCPNVVDEIFLPGNEPIQIDRLYRKMEIDRSSKRLATVFTPTDMITERVFFIAPPQAAEWARQAGLQTPPEVYDSIPLELPEWPNAVITSPQAFEAVGGQVSIRGTANGEAFDSFRIQVGQGLNPQTWLQVGQDVDQPVNDGQLANWDTRGLSGLYALQLLVVHQDKSAQRATIMVTVDNLPPEVHIDYPVQGVEIAPSGNVIVLRVQAEDDLGVAQVAFYLDQRLIASLDHPPYAISWQPKSGSHRLLVEASDSAGNTSQAEVTFSIK
jgi:membrane peptidoglycan carboxypeptidase